MLKAFILNTEMSINPQFICAEKMVRSLIAYVCWCMSQILSSLNHRLCLLTI